MIDRNGRMRKAGRNSSRVEEWAVSTPYMSNMSKMNGLWMLCCLRFSKESVIVSYSSIDKG